jgi:hypothetical protein
MVGSSPMLITRLAGCECIVSIDGDRGTIDRDCCKTDNDLKGVIGLSGGALILGFSPWWELELWSTERIRRHIASDLSGRREYSELWV